MTDRDDRYPDVPIDATGADRLLPALAEWDANHREKTIGLLLLAYQELQYAIDDGDLPPDASLYEIANVIDEIDDLAGLVERASDEQNNDDTHP